MVEIPFAGRRAFEEQLTTALATELGVAVSYDVSIGTRVIFDGSPSLQQQAVAEAIVTGHGALGLSADQGSIDADGVDAAVVSWDGVGGVDVFDWTIRLNGETFASGVDNSAPFQITFSTVVAGTYVLAVRKTGTNETGFIEVAAV